MASNPVCTKLGFIRNLTAPRVLGAASVLLCAAACLLATPPAQTPNGTAPLPAQSPAPKSIPGTHPVHRHKKAERAAPDPAPVVVERPPDPPPPDWPALAQANPADVHFTGSNLSVVAQNSSLQEILHEITTAAGVKVEGFSSDQRIFGNYGPAPARDVINQLLSGTGYNVLMIGDSGEGTPRQIVLTFHGGAVSPGQPGTAQPSPNGEDDQAEEPEVQEQPEPPVVNRPFRNQPPGAPP